MIKSIQYFNEESIKKIGELEHDFHSAPTDIASYVMGITAVMQELGLKIISETLEDLDKCLRDSPRRKRDWLVEKNVTKQLITSLGAVNFKKTLFTRRDGTDMRYLLDDLMHFEEHERMTDDAVAKMLQEAAETSYRRGGEEASPGAGVSKETVKDKLHALRFPEDTKEPAKKKEVKNLYIDADEDHASLQFREHRGDLETNDNGYKNNCQMTKLVYIYEGIEKEGPENKRRRLINPHYFSGTHEGSDANRKFWNDIYAYIDRNYDIDKMDHLYLNADGGAWISAGLKETAGVEGVLDEFHLMKYMMKIVRHMQDSDSDARSELKKVISNGTKKEFIDLVEKIDGYAGTESEHRHVAEGRDYILSNWKAARTRLAERKTVVGCSAEGHVSHVLASRMSSRPMGWSRTGADKMAQLRAYYYNKGDMLELARFQKAELPVAAGAENEILSMADIQASERRSASDIGKYVDKITHTLGSEFNKTWLNNFDWDKFI